VSSNEYDGPRRAYRLVIDLEADDYAELLNAFDSIAIQLVGEQRRDGAEITSGGYGSSWHLELAHNNSQTGDRYRRELTEWCDRRREERRARREEESDG